MNYLEELGNRSMVLWQSLFGGERSAEGDGPVYIDRAAAVSKETAAVQQRADERAGQNVPEAADDVMEETRSAELRAGAGRQVRTASDAEEGTQMSRRAAVDGVAEHGAVRLLKQTMEPVLARRGAAPPEMEGENVPGAAPEQESGAQGGAAAPFAPAALLLARVRQAEQRAAAARQPQTLPETAAPGAPADPGGVRPADWSLCFEKDARRYDGAYELL